MVGVEPILKILRYAIASGKVQNEIPVSILLIARPEAGKTSMLQKFQNMPGIRYLTDVTAAGLYDIAREIEREEVHHLLVPDLLKLIHKKSSTVQNLITALNCLLVDGRLEIHTYERRSSYNNLRCGLLTAITPEEVNDRRHKWNRIGFLSRLLPVSYSYSKILVAKIFKFISEGRHLQCEMEVLNLPQAPVDVKLNPSLAKQLILDAAVLAKAWKLYGFRLQTQLQALAKGKALLEGRNEVVEEDIDEIKKLLIYANFDQRPVTGILPIYSLDELYPYNELEELNNPSP